MHIYLTTLLFFLGLTTLDARVRFDGQSSVLQVDEDHLHNQEALNSMESKNLDEFARETGMRQLKNGFNNDVSMDFDQKIMGIPLKFWLVVVSIIFITAACSCNWLCCFGCCRRRRRAALSSREASEDAADATKVKQKPHSKSKTAPLEMNRGLSTILEESEEEASSKVWTCPV